MSLTKSLRSKRAKFSRDKGKRGERLIVHKLRAAGFTAERGWQASPNRKEPDIISNFPARLEIKDQERLNIQKAIRQAEDDNKGALPSCVVFKASRGTWYAAVPLEYLLGILRVP
jgi:hypothetical protein